MKPTAPIVIDVITSVRSDVFAALFSWVDATHDLRSSAGGDECYWHVLCAETGQSLINDLGNCGLSHRSPRNAAAAERIVREMIMEDALLQIERIASALRYHNTECPDVYRRCYDIRPAGPVVVLRRSLDITRDGSRGDLLLSSEAILQAADAIARARACARSCAPPASYLVRAAALGPAERVRVLCDDCWAAAQPGEGERQ